jgi:hypothetical protein
LCALSVITVAASDLATIGGNSIRETVVQRRMPPWHADPRFGDAVQRVRLLQYGDHPMIEPGDLWVRVLLDAAMRPAGRVECFGHQESGAPCRASWSRMRCG